MSELDEEYECICQGLKAKPVTFEVYQTGKNPMTMKWRWRLLDRCGYVLCRQPFGPNDSHADLCAVVENAERFMYTLGIDARIVTVEEVWN